MIEIYHVFYRCPHCEYILFNDSWQNGFSDGYMQDRSVRCHACYKYSLFKDLVVLDDGPWSKFFYNGRYQ